MKAIRARRFILCVCAVAALAASAADVTITKPYFRWLFHGFGFQNSEANFLRIMPADFRDQRVLKTFREIAPSFGRVYTGFADSTREELDAFADYYDLTFRPAKTTLYAVPCAMPALPETLDPVAYAEKVATNLAYLVNVRGCRKIRYYCLTNELMAGDRWDYFSQTKKWEVYKAYNAALFEAFRRQGLDIRLLATDKSASGRNPDDVFESLEWAKANMGDYIGAYCTHRYVFGRRTDDLDLWQEYNAYFDRLVQFARKASNKRYILGEWGFHPAYARATVMQDDTSYHLRQPETRAESVLAKCEIGLAAMNSGVAACVDWSFVDYPDPFVVEDGDSPEERARYSAGRSGYRIDGKYNKCGIFRWSSIDRDYAAYEELYAMGWLVKLFRKDATVLPCAFADPMLRGGAILNADRSVSIALINRGPAKNVTVDCASWKARTDGTPALHQPLRRIVYDLAHVPYSAFNDLQAASGMVTATGGVFGVSLPAKSMTFLTTGLCRAEVALDALDELLRYFALERAAWTTNPLNPAVTARRLNLADFGAKGDGVTDDAPSFERAFAAVRARTGAPCVLEIPAGTYLLVGAKGDFEPHLDAGAISNCVVAGASQETTRLVLGRYDGDGLGFTRAYNSTLQDVQLYWRETPFGEGTVEEVSKAKGWIVVRHRPGTLRPNDPRFARVGHPNSCVQFDADRRPIRKPVLWFDYRCEDLGDGRYRMHFAPEYASTKKMDVDLGATFVFPDRNNRLHVTRCADSTLFTYRRVWIRNSRSGSFTTFASEWPSIVDCRISPLRDDSCLSTNADSAYSASSVYLAGCEFTNMNDDGVNAHDKGGLVGARLDDRTLEHDPYWGCGRRGLLHAVSTLYAP